MRVYVLLILAAPSLTSAVDVVEEVPEPVQRATWEIALMVLGGLAAGIGVARFIFKVAKPHLERYIESVVAPIREQVTPNGDSTKHERGVTSADRLVKIERVAAANTRAISALTGHLAEHNARNRRFLDAALPRLQQHGIELADLVEDEPDPNPRRDDR